MKIESNIEDVIKKLEEFSRNGGHIDLTDALVAAVNDARARLQFRIFNTGQDSNNESLGVYVGVKKPTRIDPLAATPYERKRRRYGRQILYKDLEFFGTLRRAIVTANSYNEAVCIFNSPVEADIAIYQEQQIASIRATGSTKSVSGRVPIFVLSTQEKEELIKIINEGLKQIYDRIFNS